VEGNEVSVLSLSRRFGKLERDVLQAALFFLGTLGKKSVSIDVFLVNERRMRAINKKYRGKNSSANVLAFKEPDDFPRLPNHTMRLGEVYLSPAYIKEHDEELDYMLLHGILHLAGFNHENKSDRIRMEKIEEDFITQWRNNKF